MKILTLDLESYGWLSAISFVYTYDGFCKVIKQAFGEDDERVEVQPTFAILDYKSYYDQFIDKHLVDKYSRMDFTQLYFKTQPSNNSDLIEGSSNPAGNLLVRTNYRKFGQEYTIFCEKILRMKEV